MTGPVPSVFSLSTTFNRTNRGEIELVSVCSFRQIERFWLTYPIHRLCIMCTCTMYVWCIYALYPQMKWFYFRWRNKKVIWKNCVYLNWKLERILCRRFRHVKHIIILYSIFIHMTILGHCKVLRLNLSFKFRINDQVISLYSFCVG